MSAEHAADVEIARKILDGDAHAFDQFMERCHPMLVRLARSALTAGQLERAETLARQAAVLRSRGDLARARALLTEVLAIREKAAPESFEVANALTSIGVEAFARGALDEAGRAHERALAIRAAWTDVGAVTTMSFWKRPRCPVSRMSAISTTHTDRPAAAAA